MQARSTFGKRALPPEPTRKRSVVLRTDAQDAVFAAIRADTAADAPRPVVVPKSFRAALLAGLVVGCGLAGLDATHAGEKLQALSGGLLSAGEVPRLVPVVITLGLLGGARAAATSLFMTHAALRRAGLTSHLAYALGGGAVAAAISAVGVVLAAYGLVDAAVLPTHGIAADLEAGVGAGFLYRVLAGARYADE